MELSQIHATTCHTLKQVIQNAKNNLARFLMPAFNAFLDGVLRFAHSVAPLEFRPYCRLVVNSQQAIRILQINEF